LRTRLSCPEIAKRATWHTRRKRGPRRFGAEPKVRIQLPPAQSQERTVGDASGAGVEEVSGVAGLGQHLGMRREHLADGVAGPQRRLTGVGRVPVSGWSKAKARLDRAVSDIGNVDDVDDFDIYDFRRTMRTNLSGLGVSPSVAELVTYWRSGMWSAGPMAGRSSVKASVGRVCKGRAL
jgi:hypothetical protein